ncbi:MAG: extracellular solute-binding protein [Treponema sp.]|nr:extracellular solute-binding protein [Treponema sp.]
MAKLKINKTLRNLLIAVAAIILIFVCINLIPEKKLSDKYEGYDLTTSTSAVSAGKPYTEYLAEHSNAKNPDITVPVDIFAFDVDKSSGASLVSNYQGKNVVLTDDHSSVTWYVDVPQEGFYNIEMEYICPPSRNVDIERILYINDEMPFTGADALTFSRLWKDGGEIKYDNRGNMIRPSQVETQAYQLVRFKSDLGYEVEPYYFYFNKGRNSISMEAISEPASISSLSLVPVKKYDTYEQYLAKKPANSESKGVYIKVQGENSAVRSDPSLFARYDRSSAITEPYSTKQSILNYIGGDSWKSSGQWIEWDFEVPENGWYTISLKGRQFFQRGYVAYRSVYIDDEIPIDALKSVGFKYDSDWQFKTLSDENKTPYRFYFTKGKHTIKLEATLGDVGPIINQIENAVYRLNLIYRTILVLTGTSPDADRDYEIHKVFPDEVQAMLQESRRLYKIVDDFIAVTGQKSNQISPAENLAVQLEKFYKHPDRITKNFQNFKDNTTTLASSMLSLTETKLDIDYIVIQSADDKIKPDKSNFFKNARHEIGSFINSFLYDSAALGSIYGENEEHLIEVWIVTGRDQSQVLKNMIDDTFTPQTGIKINVKLISPDALLSAVVAGKGPDVVISTYTTQPVDYALRNANVNLMRFDDCEEVLTWFKESAYEPFKYDGGLYALPEQESFNLMFYRKDILEQLGIPVPQTWEDFINMLPTLQSNNLTVGVPYPNVNVLDMSVLYSMIYQADGRIYNPAGDKSIVDSEAGISAFKTYTSLYNNYGIPLVYDFMSRFRTGEMPVGIANYTTYNTIVVGAPEIRNLWDFTYIPGTINSQGELDRSNAASGVCTMMIKNGINLDDLDLSSIPDLVYSSFSGKTFEDGVIPGVDQKTWAKVMKNETIQKDAWEFMKWWVSAETQVRYGREMEAILGASARYATANVEALKQLSWNSSQIEILEESLDQTFGVPEVPGSYFTPRHIVNAARKVVNEKDDPRETLIDYTRKINEELTRKRLEFNLPVARD